MHDRWSEWQEKQRASLAEYHSPTYITRWDDYRERFGIFCNATGTVLDVGCGVAAIPMRYARRENVEVVGLDPLSPHRPQYCFVRGVGEYLPFRDEAFDACTCFSVLDHLIDPKPVLHEIRRVLHSDGKLCVCSGIYRTQEISLQLASLVSLSSFYIVRRRELLGYLRNLIRGHHFRFLLNPLRYVRGVCRGLLELRRDPRHFRHYSVPYLVTSVKRARLRVVKMEVLENSVFLLAQKTDH